MFILLVGCPGVGKTTWAENFKKEHKGVCIVSSDSIRKELWGDENIQNEPEKVFKIAHDRIFKALCANTPYVIFDATNITRKSRMSIMNKLEKIKCEKNCLIFAEPYETLCLRNETRSRRVPNEVIWRMITQFEVPLKSEGYDKITIVNTEKRELSDYLDLMQYFNQDNSNHSLELLSHCSTAARYINEYLKTTENSNKILYNAALLHDVGKCFTKSYKDYKGRDSVQAHYYNHEKVGSYLAFIFDTEWDDFERLTIAQLICYHMIPYTINTDKARERWKKRLGYLYDSLMLLHEADKNAH